MSKPGELGFLVPTVSLEELGLKGNSPVNKYARSLWLSKGKPKGKNFAKLKMLATKGDKDKSDPKTLNHSISFE